MSKRSRDKGKRGEVENVTLCEAHGLTAKRTSMMQTADDEHFPDVTAWHKSGLTIAIECKNTKSLPSVGTMKAIVQSDGAYPGVEDVARVVTMREQGKPGSFIVAMRESTFFDLLDRLKPNRETSK